MSNDREPIFARTFVDELDDVRVEVIGRRGNLFKVQYGERVLVRHKDRLTFETSLPDNDELVW